MKIHKTLPTKRFQELFDLVKWMETAPEDFLEDWQVESLRDQMNQMIDPLLQGKQMGASFRINYDAVEVHLYDDDGDAQDDQLVIRRKLK